MWPDIFYKEKQEGKKINERETKGLIEQCDRDRNFNENSIRQVSASEKEKHSENNLDTESERLLIWFILWEQPSSFFSLS